MLESVGFVMLHLSLACLDKNNKKHATAQNAACQVNCLRPVLFLDLQLQALERCFDFPSVATTTTREKTTPSPCFVFVDSQFSPQGGRGKKNKTVAGFHLAPPMENFIPVTSFPALRLALYRSILAASRESPNIFKSNALRDDNKISHVLLLLLFLLHIHTGGLTGR